jgi:hypothetical protein
MINSVEDFPGQIKQLESFIEALEKQLEEKNKLIEWYIQRINSLETYSRELESKVYGGSTK